MTSLTLAPQVINACWLVLQSEKIEWPLVLFLFDKPCAWPCRIKSILREHDSLGLVILEQTPNRNKSSQPLLTRIH